MFGSMDIKGGRLLTDHDRQLLYGTIIPVVPDRDQCASFHPLTVSSPKILPVGIEPGEVHVIEIND